MEEDTPPKAKPPPPPTHCDVPLTYVNVRKALLQPAPSQFINPANPCKREWNSIRRSLGCQNPTHWEPSRLQNFLLNTWVPPGNPDEMSRFWQSLNIASDLMQLQVTAYHESLGLEAPPFALERTLSNTELTKKYLLRSFFEEAVILSGSNASEEGFWWKKQGSHWEHRGAAITMAVSKNLWWISTAHDTTILCSRDHLTIMSDLASQRYIIELTANLAEENHIFGYPSPYALNTLFLSGDQMLEKKGNRAYDLIYTLEESCVSRFAGDPENRQGPSKFRAQIQAGLREKAESLDLTYELTQREGLLDEIYEDNINHLSQVYGLYRIWGHPTLEPLEGVIATKHLAKSPRLYRPDLADEITNKFKEAFITRWINKHKSWPELDVSKLAPFNILRTSYENNRAFPNQHPLYSRKHLSLIGFEKLFPVDPKFDIVELISDKAVSLGWDELIATIFTRKSIGDSISRSLLLKWIESDLSDPAIFLAGIDELGFPLEEKTVGVREKEREGKLKARLFGLMTLIKRTYIVLTEKLLAEHLLPLFPEITMTDDELLLEKKRFSVTNYDLETVMFISLDFSKWNTNMRHLDTESFFHTIDQMFGFKSCFTRTHEMFMNSQLYLIDGSYLPQVDGDKFKEDFGCWSGHLGGIEGLRQKGWTLWTINLILLIAEDFDFTLQLMGQGDNQMLILKFYDDLSKEVKIQQTTSFLYSLDNYLSKIGPPLKVAETWYSWDFFLYGKYPIWRGQSLMMSLKKMCRMFRLSNEDYPTLESTLSSLAANLFSSMASDHSSQLAFFVYLHEAIGAINNFLYKPYLQPEKVLKQLTRTKTITMPFNEVSTTRVAIPDILVNKTLQPLKFYQALLLTPRSLGGYPIILYASCQVKGFPDQLSYDIATLKQIHNFAPLAIKHQLLKTLNPYLCNITNYTLLLQNPEVLNLDLLSTPQESRKGLILEFLKSSPRVKNQYLKDFLALVGPSTNSQLVQYLTSPEEICPKVLTVFFKATPEARALDVVGKLQKTSTLSRLYLREGSRDMSKRIESVEFKHFCSILRNLFSENPRNTSWTPDKCSQDHASQLRNIGWRKIVYGVDVAPPHEMFKVEIPKANESCHLSPEWLQEMGYISVRMTAIKKNLPIHQDYSSPETLGTSVPYRGSVTKSKNESLGSKLQGKTSSLLRRALDLAAGAGWLYEKEGPMGDLARSLVAAVTDLDFDLLTPDLDQLSGSFEHRLRVDRVDNGGVVPYLPNQATKIHLDTSPLVGLNKGSKNKNFMFQSILVTIVSLLGQTLSRRLPLDYRMVLHVHVKTKCCLRDLREEPLTMGPPVSPIEIFSNPESPYLWVSKEDLEEYLKIQQRFPLSKNISEDPRDIHMRYHSLLAYDLLMILDPLSWTTGGNPKLQATASAVSINCAMPVDLSVLMTYMSLYMIGLFHTTYELWSSKDLIDSVISIVNASDLNNWEYLFNLSFASGFDRQIASVFGPHNLQKHEYLTTIDVAVILKKICITTLLRFRAKSDLIPHLHQFWASPSVPTGLHPGYYMHLYLSLITQEFLDGDKYSMLKSLCIKEGLGKSEIHQLHQLQGPIYMLTAGITSESLDVLCKEIDPPDLPPSRTDQIARMRNYNLAHASKILSTVKEENLRMRALQLAEIGPRDDLSAVKRNKDFKGHRARLLPLSSNGSLKMASLLHHLNPEHLRHTACIADGAGGFTRVMLQNPHTETVFYNTLVTSAPTVPQMSPIPYVPDLGDLDVLHLSKLEGLQVTNDLPSDITFVGYPEIIQHWVRPHFGTITGDAESLKHYQPTHMLSLAMAYRDCAMQWSSYQGVFKFYAGNQQLLAVIIGILMGYFGEVKVVRSFFTDPESYEVYLVCSHPKDIATAIRGTNQGESISMYIPSNDTRNNLYLECRRMLTTPPQLNQETIRQYSQYIMPNNWYINMIYSLLVDYVWIDYTNGHGLMIEFPDALIRSIELAHYQPGPSSSSTLKRQKTHFSLHEIGSWCLSWLLGYALCCENQEITVNLEMIVEKGNLIWYRKVNRKWGLTCLDCNLPEAAQLRDTVVYPFKTHLPIDALKKIQKSIGMAREIGYSVSCLNPVTLSGMKCLDPVSMERGELPRSSFLKNIIKNSTSKALESSITPPASVLKFIALEQRNRIVHFDKHKRIIQLINSYRRKMTRSLANVPENPKEKESNAQDPTSNK